MQGLLVSCLARAPQCSPSLHPVILQRHYSSLFGQSSRRATAFLNHLSTPLRNRSSMSTRQGSKQGDFRRLLGLCRPERHRIAAAIGLLAVSSAVSMSVPFALGKIIDLIYSLDQLKTEDEESHKATIRDRLQNVCLGLTGVFLLGGLCNFGRIYLMRLSGQRITAALRTRVFSSVTRQETAFFDTTKTGELINRLSADTQLVSQTVTQQVSDGLRSAMMTLAGVGMMVYMSPQLACVGLAIVPPVSAWGILMGRKVKGISKELQEALAASTSLAQEKLSNIRTVRSFAMESREVAGYSHAMEAVLTKAERDALVQAQFYGVTGLAGNMIVLTVLYYGGNLVTTNVLTVGNLASFVLYSAYVGIGLSGVSTFYAEMMKGLGASSRLWELVDRTPSIPVSGGHIPSQPQGHISLSDVTFSYPSRPQQTVLAGLSLDLPPRTVLAVVGASGSGKSTIGSLLLRLYTPDSGKIMLDGQDISTIDPSFLRTYIGTVSQEPVLFSASIRDNILYGAPRPEDVTQQELEQAAQEANAHSFISSFPEGYDTMVGERGVMLSGGQKQRVAIARAIIKQPGLLLLDEATSALDAQSEHEVKVALERIMTGRSVVMIAHRLSTIRSADVIAVLEGGRVVETGSYQELVGKEGGVFRRLQQLGKLAQS